MRPPCGEAPSDEIDLLKEVVNEIERTFAKPRGDDDRQVHERIRAELEARKARFKY
jgi:hypothetical protein